MIGSYLLKVMAVQLLAFGLYRLVLASTNLHRLKRYYLLLAPLLAFTVPLLTVRTVIIVERLPELTAGNFSTVVASVPDLAGIPLNPLSLLWLVYAFGVLVAASRFVSNLLNFKRQNKTAITIASADGARWYALPHPVAPHSFGRCIYFSANQEISPAIRAHELAHVHQRHSVDRLLIRLLRIGNWFNPVLWLYERAIIHNHELLADAAAINRLKLSPSQYQKALLGALAGPRQLSPLGSFLPFSFTKKRFTMLQHPGTSPLGKCIRLLTTVMVWGCLLFAFGHTAYAQQAPPPPPTAPVPPSAAAVPPPPPPVAPGEKLPVPCPPPPPPTMESLRPYLNYTYAEWRQVWVKKAQETNPDCYFAPMSDRKVDPKVKMRDWFLELQLKQLERLTNAQSLTAEEYRSYQDANTYGVWLDGRRIKNSALTDYPRTSLYRLQRAFKLYSNAKDYGKYQYHLELKSQEGLDRIIAQLRADIAELKGE